jgi:sterol 14-demethylase
MGTFRIVVDKGLCQGHSVCMAEAPEIFRVVDSDNAYPMVDVILESPPADLLSKAENAAEFCPNGVITIVYEDDPAEGGTV